MLPNRGDKDKRNDSVGDIELGRPLLSEDSSDQLNNKLTVYQEPDSTPLSELSTLEIYSRLASYLWIDANIPKIIQASGLTALGIAFNFLGPFLMQKTMESLNTKEPVNIAGITLSSQESIVALIVALGCSQLIPTARDKLLISISETTTKKILVDLSDYMMHKNMDFHRNTEDGDKTFVISKGFSVSGNASALLTQIIPIMFEIIVAVCTLCFQYGLNIGVGLMGVMGIYSVYSYLASPKILAAFESSQEAGSKTWRMLTSVPSQYKMIWDFNRRDDTLQQIEKVTQDTADIMIKARVTSLEVNQIQIVISRAGMLLAALYMGQRILANQKTAGDFLALITYLNQLSNALPAFGAAINQLLSSNPAVALVFEKLMEQPEVVDSYPDVPLNIGEQSPTIEFRNVTFGYPVKYFPCLMSVETFMESDQPRALAVYMDSDQLKYSLKVNGDIIIGYLNPKDLPNHYTSIRDKATQSNTDASLVLNEEERKALLNVTVLKEHIAREPVQTLLKDVSFTINPDQMVVLVSESGAGKSSLFDLLYRYYDPLEGEIYINGQNIAEVSLESLRTQVTLFRQQSVLRHDTIRNNLRDGAKNMDTVTDLQIMAAARHLKLDKFLEKKGLDTVIGDTLSGGDKQKIAMIKGLLKEGRICLFDEVTNGLDADIAEHVSAGVKTISATKMVITHKLAEVVTEADKIMVLDKKTGHISAQGTHEELLHPTTGCEIYRNLWEKQNTQNLGARSGSPSSTRASEVGATLFHRQLQVNGSELPKPFVSSITLTNGSKEE